MRAICVRQLKRNDESDVCSGSEEGTEREREERLLLLLSLGVALQLTGRAGAGAEARGA